MELLSPAGSKESFYAAVNNGCDAVYLGGKNFSARSQAENFLVEELQECLDYAHLRGVKVFAAVNILYKDSELSELFTFVSRLYSLGADALILQDIGAASFIRANFPDIKLHASTQLTAHSLRDVQFLADAGFDRVILSRELSLSEIKHTTSACKTEIEVFVHGALCMSFSGQCLLSSHIGGRSGNRGNCAQPCRLPYELMNEKEALTKGYLLSPKDIMNVDALQALKSAGVTSIKIEGRMKSPEYAALVTKAYRERLDDPDTATGETTKKDLLSVFNRGGSFSEGYLNTYSSKDLMSTETPKSTGLLCGQVLSYDRDSGRCEIQTREDLLPGDGIEIFTSREPHAGTGINKASKAGHKIVLSIKGGIHKGDKVYKSYDKQLIDKAKSLYNRDERKQKIEGSIVFKAGRPMKLTLCAGGLSVSAEGGVVEAPKNSAFSVSDVISRFSKMGDTTFSVSYTDNEIDEETYAPVSAMNSLRREAAGLLSEKITEASRRPELSFVLPESGGSKPKTLNPQHGKQLSVLVRSRDQFRACLIEGVKRIYVEYSRILSDLPQYKESCAEYGIELYLALPAITRELPDFEALDKSGIDGYLVRTFAALSALKSSAKPVALDYRFNILNGLSQDFFRRFADETAASTELALADLNSFADEKTEIVIYGRLPLMTLQSCPVGMYVENKREGRFCRLKGQARKYWLKDRTNTRFPVTTDCDNCIAFVYNSRPVCMIHKYHDLESSPAGLLRLEFTEESYDETAETVCAFADRIIENDDFAVTGLLDRLGGNFSNGHFYRGV